MFIEETGYIHFGYEEGANLIATIPMRENFAYCFFLLRTHQKDKMQEGIAHLEKLLFFQNDDGLFPTYLHQYPTSYRYDTNTFIAFTLFSIQKHYRAVLGANLKERVNISFANLLESLKKSHLSEKRRFFLDMVIFAFEGKSFPPLPSFELTAFEYGEAILYSQYSGVKYTIPWHDEMEKFLGLNSAGEMFLEALLGKEINHPYQYLASLLREKVVHNYSRILLGKFTIDRKSFHLTYFPESFKQKLRILTKEDTIVLSSTDAVEVDLVEGDEELHFIITMENFDEEDKDVYPLSLIFSECFNVTSEKGKSSIFSMQDQISISKDHLTFSLSLHEEKGAPKWMGHLAKCNRHKKKGNRPIDLIDYALLFRPVQMEESAQLRLTLTFNELGTCDRTSHGMKAVIDV